MYTAVMRLAKGIIVPVTAVAVAIAGCSVQRGGPVQGSPATPCGPVKPVGSDVVGSGFRAAVPRGWAMVTSDLHCGAVIKKEPVESTNPIATITVDDHPELSLAPYADILRARMIDDAQTKPVGVMVGGSLAGERTREFDFTALGNRTHVVVALHHYRAYVIQQVAVLDGYTAAQPSFAEFLRRWEWT